MSTMRARSALGIRGRAPRAFTLAVTLLALLWWGGATDRLGPTSADASDITYVYDGLGRLIAVVDPASDTAVFSYDATGNLLSISRQASALVSIIDFSPGSGPVGTAVTIYGTGFGPTAGQNTVMFNGTAASISSAAPTQLVVTVPVGATSGPIAVTAPAGSAASSQPFNVVGAPDLVAAALTAPTTATTQQTLPVSWRITNQGGNAQGSWVDAPFLSTDAVCCAGDTGLGSWNNPKTLDTGESYIRAVTLTVPGVPAGNYYLVLRTDYWNWIAESNETNNDRATPITVTTPDLTVPSFTVPSSVTTQQAIPVNWTVTNQGTGTTQRGWTDAPFLSTDAVCCAGDTGLGSWGNMTALGPGASYTQNTTLTVPNVPAGNYYLIVRADYWNALYEANETNNDRAIPVTVTIPDLTVSSFTVPSSVTTQQAIPVNWTVTNQGTGTTQRGWTDAPFLSTDAVCCAGDTGLGSWGNMTALGPGASYTQNTTLTVPNVPAGNYYLIVRADYWNALYEANETNNDRAIPVTVTTPDLTVPTFTGPSSATTQQAISVSWTVKNQGTGTTQRSWTDAPFLSTDAVCCGGDTGLGSWGNMTALGPGATYTRTATLTIPNVAAGNYYLAVRADYWNGLYESNETNNDKSFPIAIKTPDLTVTSVTAPATAAVGQSISVSWTVKNQGTGTTQTSWTDAPFLSTDAVCCAGDTGLGSWGNVTALGPGASYTRTATFTIPNVAAGNYYLVVRADYWNGLYEVNETNNDRAKAITITH